MCGRYAASRSPEDLVEEFEVEETTGPGPGDDPRDAAPDYNVAPTKQALVVLERRPRTEDGATAEPAQDPAARAGDDDEPEPPGEVRWLRRLTWGLVPSWAKDRSVGNRMINARAESLLDKPAYKRAALSRRCLVPADGWFEWQASPTARTAAGKPRKQPFFMRPLADGPIAFAGLYEFWRDPALHGDDPAAWLTTFVIVTTAAEQPLAGIHDRMPLVLPQDRWDAWLDPDQRDADTVRALLEPPVEGRFLATPVTTLVNAVSNNGPQLLDPAPAEQLEGVLDPATGELLGAGSQSLF